MNNSEALTTLIVGGRTAKEYYLCKEELSYYKTQRNEKQNKRM